MVRWFSKTTLVQINRYRMKCTSLQQEQIWSIKGPTQTPSFGLLPRLELFMECGVQ